MFCHCEVVINFVKKFALESMLVKENEIKWVLPEEIDATIPETKN